MQVDTKSKYDELYGGGERLVNTNPAHCQALLQRAEPHPPQSGPSVTSKCTNLQRHSSRTLQRTRQTDATKLTQGGICLG